MPARRAFSMTSATGLLSASVGSLKNGAANARLTPGRVSFSTSAVARSRPFCTASAKPWSPRASNAAPTRVARNAWFEQMLEVALSLRMCCSRVESTITQQSRPARSCALPTKRPGVARMSFFTSLLWRTANTPRPGPPKLGPMARCCPSPTRISAPWPLEPQSAGGLEPAGGK